MQTSDTESTPDYDGGGAGEPAGLPMMAAHQAVLRPDLVGLAVAHECPPTPFYPDPGEDGVPKPPVP